MAPAPLVVTVRCVGEGGMGGVPVREQVSVSVVNDYPVIVRGVAQLLEGDSRLRVVEFAAGVQPVRRVDVVLFDCFAARDPETDVSRLLVNPRFDKVVIYSWHESDQEIGRYLALGVHGYVSKKLTGSQLGSALVRVAGGDCVVLPAVGDREVQMPDWPGRDAGLTAREAQVVALITQGITNEVIAEACGLSINSVKSYIRTAYRKMGVLRRSQAVVWGVRHGMLPEPLREEERSG